jgi:hypothetical protein
MSIDDSSNIADDPAFLSDDDVPLGLGRLSNEQKRPPGPVLGNAFGPGGILNIPSQQQSQQNSARMGIRSGFRSHIRRLTSGNGDARAREAVRQQQHSVERSPQVPKVPRMYLQNTKSGDL